MDAGPNRCRQRLRKHTGNGVQGQSAPLKPPGDAPCRYRRSAIGRNGMKRKFLETSEGSDKKVYFFAAFQPKDVHPKSIKIIKKYNENFQIYFSLTFDCQCFLKINFLFQIVKMRPLLQRACLFFWPSFSACGKKVHFFVISKG